MSSHDPMLVLRFRDIGVAPGGTIKKHRRVISEHEYCWWGWLYREYEKNPHVRLGQLIAHPMTIGLYDTGQGKVYRANCIELYAAARPISSPELDLTPGYYTGQLAPAWFKLSSIEDADEDLVVGRVCTELPSASAGCFTDLEGKRVSALPDLRRQDVTLWVLS